MKKIFLLIRDQRKGPFSLEEIRRQLDSGEVGIFDVVEADGRRTTLQEILPAEERIAVPAIRLAPPTAPPPPAEVAPSGGTWGGPPPPPLQGRGYPSAPSTAFCRACGQSVMASSVICPSCGSPTGSSSYLPQPPPPTAPHGYARAGFTKSRVAYVLLGLFLGFFGIHNFYAGYTSKGVTQLLITLLIGWTLVPLLFLTIWVLLEICTVTKDVSGQAFV